MLKPAPLMRPHVSSICVGRRVGAGLAVTLALILLGIAPLAAALGVHHELAAADQDGHQHSDFDLCQWVQHHTGSSLVADVPAVISTIIPSGHEFPAPSVLLSVHLIWTGPSRAPPLS